MTNEEHAKRLEEMVEDLQQFGLDGSGAEALKAGAAALRRMEELKAALEIWQRLADSKGSRLTQYTAYQHAAAVLKRMEKA